MNYFEQRYVFYFEILKRLFVGDENAISEKVGSVFCLKRKDIDKVNLLLKDETYERLKSSDMLRIHFTAITTFCKGKNFFGETDIQKSILDVKYKALKIIEQIEPYECPELFLSERSDEPIFAFLNAFLYILNGAFDRINFLRPFVLRGVRDAGLLYAYLFENEREETLSALNFSGVLSEEEINAICEYYSIKKENILSLRKHGIGFGITNERIGF